MWTLCHGVGGNGDICSGSGLVLGSFAWQARQPSSSFSTSQSILGNQIFSLSSCLVLTIPWCPLCAKAKSRWCNLLEMTKRVPLRMRSSALLTVSSLRTQLKSFNSATFTYIGSESLISAHLFLRISSKSFWSVLSAFVSRLISSSDLVFGMQWS